jgi:flagellar hook assembly protein FlgD
MIRTAWTILLVPGAAILISGCLPGSGGNGPDEPTVVAATISTPTRDVTLPAGTVLDIQWSAAVSDGAPATARLYVESRVDLSIITLAANVDVAGGFISRTTAWDTSGLASGLYVIYAEVVAGTDSASTTAPGRVTIDEAPTFNFTEPTEDVTLDEDNPTVTIGWIGQDSEDAGTATLGIDADADHENGNEVFIHEAVLTAVEEDGSFDWDGTDLAGESIAPGTYNLFALVEDEAGNAATVDALATFTIVEPPDDGDDDDAGGDVTLGITTPEEDTTLLRGETFDIEFGINEFDDVLVDLRIDTDDLHTNGNEQTILSQRLISGGTETDRFTWDGTLSDGSDADPGIYRVFIVMNAGGTTPQTAEADGLIFLREEENQPLIALLEPATPRTVTPGETSRIAWRDDDPGEEATIALAIDDDPNPSDGDGGADDMAELEILTGREAVGDGDVLDSFFYAIPGSLEPGTYYVFAYIDAAPGSGEPRQVSVAPATFIIEDPANP